MAQSQKNERYNTNPKEVLSEAQGSARILIVEDNLRYAVQLMRNLKETAGPFANYRFDVNLVPDALSAEDFLKNDNIDIYIVDLGLVDPTHPGDPNSDIGRDFVKKIIANSKAGVIVHSSLSATDEAAAIMALGADDYIQKPANSDLIKAKVLALWRRVQMTQRVSARSFTHAKRKFKIGRWIFTIGERTLRASSGDVTKLTVTEHAILRHLCVVEENELNKETFNAEILGRPTEQSDKRVDNYIYKLRTKLGETVQLTSKKDGSYRLLDVTEIH